MALKCELMRFDADHERAEVKCAECKKSVFVSFADIKNVLRFDECAEILCYDCAVSRNGDRNDDTRSNAAVYRNDDERSPAGSETEDSSRAADRAGQTEALEIGCIPADV